MSLRHGGDVDEVYQRRISFITKTLGYLPHVVEIMPNGLSVFRVGQNAAHQIATNALYTTEPNILLAITPADCHPIFIIDPGTPAVALIHGGRKEATGGIVAMTIDQMVRDIGTNPSDCSAIIGPGIRSCCYHLDRISDEERGILGEHCVETKHGWTIDLVGFHFENLKQSGIPGVLALPQCTACSENLFFSHYRSFRNALPEERFFSGIVITQHAKTIPLRSIKESASTETLVPAAA